MDTLEWIKRNYSAVIERDPSFSEVMPVPVHVFSFVFCVIMLVYSISVYAISLYSIWTRLEWCIVE